MMRLEMKNSGDMLLSNSLNNCSLMCILHGARILNVDF